ncbi:MAG: AMP-binding enzyme, partial [Thermoplasmata archaeon]
IGYLVAKKPSPSMTRGLWKNDEKYVVTYWSKFPGTWFHGDWASMDSDGYFYLYGRSDDVIKVAGKRIGPAEIENIVMEVNGVEECAAIGVPDEMKGESIAVFYTGRHSDDLEKRIKQKIESEIGKPFSPKYMVNLSSLPKTRNGKIMRRIIKSAFTGADIGDTSNIEDMSVIEEIKKRSIK